MTAPDARQEAERWWWKAMPEKVRIEAMTALRAAEEGSPWIAEHLDAVLGVVLAWQAAQPVVVSAEQREAFARVIFDADYAQGELVGDAPDRYDEFRPEYLRYADVAYGHLGITVEEES
jgi:hypothetical protein